MTKFDGGSGGGVFFVCEYPGKQESESEREREGKRFS
jgi:hypothetical protein